MFVSPLTNLEAESWVAAIVFGVVLGAFGAGLFIGLTQLYNFRENRRHQRQALAARLRAKIQTLQGLLQDAGDSNNEDEVMLALQDAESLFSLSQLMLPPSKSQTVVEFYEKAKHYASAARSSHGARVIHTSSGRGIGSRIPMADSQEALEAASAALTILRRY
jgi:hypothetical protein